MLHKTSLLALLLAHAATSAPAADHVVDAAGTQSDLTTIGQAMAVASPGDRILVLPGNYPAFQFSRGVEVIGLGAEPTDVVVARVDYHVTIPTHDYDTVLANLSVCGGGPADSISISGNELAGGTFLIDAVQTCGGVFLHGDADFYLLVNDSVFEPPPGGGFAGAAFDFGGGRADFVGSTVRAWDALVAQDLAAGIALRLADGAALHASGTELAGGRGQAGADIALEHGAAAVVSNGPLAARIRLAGGSLARGGDGAAQGAGGAGVALSGTILLGDATVVGGQGAPPGAAFAVDAPTWLPYDPELLARPVRPPSEEGQIGPRSTAMTAHLDATVAGPGTIGSAPSIDPPGAAPHSPLPPDETTLVPGNAWKLGEPVVVGGGAYPFGRRTFVQGFFVDPLDGQPVATNPLVLLLAP